jgi:hypothetical protein
MRINSLVPEVFGVLNQHSKVALFEKLSFEEAGTDKSPEVFEKLMEEPTKLVDAGVACILAF